MNDREWEILKVYGYRSNAQPVFEPQELGYRCPQGHSNITWSEFKQHIWCNTCKLDFHYAKDCYLLWDAHNPKDLPEQPRVITGPDNWKVDGESFNDGPALGIVADTLPGGTP